MPVLVGTSGWQYRDWRGRFYPARVRDELVTSQRPTASAARESGV